MHNFRLIQITDTHLMQNPEAHYRAQPVYKNLQRAIASASQQNPDALLLTGDLAEDEKQKTYQLLPTLFHDWPSPIYWIPGNHDNFELMQQNLIGEAWHADKAFALGNWQMVLLNSKLPYDSGEGCVDAAQLKFLQQQLESEKFVFVILHHPVLPMHGHMDKYALQNADALLSILKAHNNVKLVLSGHVHQESNKVKHGIRFLTSPSTSFQIKPGMEKYVPDDLPPGYRIIDLYEDGSVKTEVVRV